MTNPRRAAIEPLEARIAPAGIITASYLAGKLTLTGDAEANDFDLTSSGAGSYNFTGNAGTTIVFNGDPAVSSLAIPLPITDLVISLGAGTDSVALSGLTLGKGLKVDAGAGSDNVTISSTRIDGLFTFLGGAGTDVLELAGGTFHAGRIAVDLGTDPGTLTASSSLFTVKGDFIVKGGAASDTVTLSSTRFQVGGNFSLLLGSAASTVTVTAGTFAVEKVFTLSQSLVDTPSNLAFTTPTFDVGRDFLLTSTGTAETTFNVDSTNSFAVGGKTVLKGGAGDDTYDFQTARVAFFGGVNAALGNGGNTVSITGSEAAQFGALKYLGGAGSDGVQINGNETFVVTGGVDVQLGGGSNGLTLIGTDLLTLGGTVKITSGAGTDIVAIVGDLLTARKGFTVSLGAGENGFGLGGDVAHVSGAVTYLGGDAGGASQMIQVQAATAFFGAGFSIQTPIGGVSANFINLGSLTIIGDLRVSALGAGDKALTISSGEMRIGGALAFTGGSGSNTLTVNSTSYHLGRLKVLGGVGTDSVFLNGSGQVAGLVDVQHGAGENSFTVDGGADRTAFQQGLKYLSTSTVAQLDLLSLTGVALPGAVSVRLGAGDSDVTLDDILATGAITLDTGAGNDTVNFESIAGSIVSTYRGAVKLKLGAGNDLVNIGFFNAPLGVVQLRNSLTIDGGADLDLVTQLNLDLALNGSITTPNVP